jgi:hypothetical protein
MNEVEHQAHEPLLAGMPLNEAVQRLKTVPAWDEAKGKAVSYEVTPYFRIVAQVSQRARGAAIGGRRLRSASSAFWLNIKTNVS